MPTSDTLHPPRRRLLQLLQGGPTHHEPSNASNDQAGHIEASRLYGRTRPEEFAFRDRLHLVTCRQCRLLIQVEPAVAIADNFEVREPQPSPSGWRLQYRAALRILDGWRRAYLPLFFSPTRLPYTMRSTASLLLLLLKGTLRAAGALRHSWLPDTPRPKSTDPLHQWKDGLSVRATAKSASEVAECWEPHMLATLRRRPSKHKWREHQTALARVAFAGADNVPIGCLVATHAEPRDLEILIPSIFIPANNPEIMKWAAATHRGTEERPGRHVVVIDPREAPGWTSWFSPGARMTGGWLEGLDIALIVKDIREQLGPRVNDVVVRGVAHGANVALWSVVHAIRQDITINRIKCRSPYMHVGALLAHLYPSRLSTFVNVFDPAFESRSFFRLMFDIGLSRYSNYGFGPGDAIKYLRAAGLPEDDLAPIPPEVPRGFAADQPRGDLRAALPELREAVLRGILREVTHSPADPLIPRQQVQHLVDAINAFTTAHNIETLVADRSGYRQVWKSDESGLGAVADDKVIRLMEKFSDETNTNPMRRAVSG